MEMADIYQIISLVCFGIGGLFLIGAAVVFFHLRIIEVIGELTGRTKRKHIEAYRKGIEELRPVLKNKEENPTDFTHIFENVQDGIKKGSGDTVLLIEPACAAAEEMTSALSQDGEEDDKTAVM